MVVTTSPILSLYNMVVFPAASFKMIINYKLLLYKIIINI